MIDTRHETPCSLCVESCCNLKKKPCSLVLYTILCVQYYVITHSKVHSCSDCMTIRITIEFYISSRFPLWILGQAGVSTEIGRGYIVNPQFHTDVVKRRFPFHLLYFIFARPAKNNNTKWFSTFNWPFFKKRASDWRVSDVGIPFSSPKVQRVRVSRRQALKFSQIAFWCANQLMADPKSGWN